MSLHEKNNVKNKSGSQIVIICDEPGIYSAFGILKETLKENETAWISLLYEVSPENVKPLFETELEILENRFRNKLLVFMIRSDTDSTFYKQRILEALINSNTSEEIRFFLSGKPEFEGRVYEILRFLNVEKSTIEIIS